MTSMKCQHCPKSATLQITEVLADSKYEEFHFCEDCAQKYLYSTAVKSKPSANVKDAVDTNDKCCEHCGTRFVDFRNSGRLGCPHDYQLFQGELLPLLENIHSSTRHTG